MILLFYLLFVVIGIISVIVIIVPWWEAQGRMSRGGTGAAVGEAVAATTVGRTGALTAVDGAGAVAVAATAVGGTGAVVSVSSLSRFSG